jgi:hypothetical protein
VVTAGTPNSPSEQFDGFDVVLSAIGRKPVTDLLNLKIAGVETNDRGYITVDAFENTSAENIYAIGDATNSGYELTPVAIAAGRRLADRIFGGCKDVRIEYASIATVVFSHPPIGTIGLTEPDARKEFGDANVQVKQARFPSMLYCFNGADNKVHLGRGCGALSSLFRDAMVALARGPCAHIAVLTWRAVGPNTSSFLAVPCVLTVRSGCDVTLWRHAIAGEDGLEAGAGRP